MKNNPSTVSKEFKVLTEKELQKICGGDKRRKNNVAELINLIFGRGGN
jgi:bacteriocin-type signal sequence